MRFAIGFVAGVFLGHPILSALSEHLTPPVRRKITDGVNNLADYLNSRIENHGQGEEQ